MSWQRRKGTDYENHVMDKYLVRVFPDVDRAPLKGTNDAGDFINTRGLICEAKKRNSWRLPEWIRVVHGKSLKFGLPWTLWFAGDKRKGGALGQDFVVLPAETFTKMLGIIYDADHADDPFNLYGPDEVPGPGG